MDNNKATTRGQALTLKIVGLFLYEALVAIYVYFFNLDYYTASLLTLVPPALINFFWLTIARAKILFFALTMTMLLAPLLALMSRLVVNDNWQSPAPILAIANLGFSFFMILWVASFYKYFVIHEQVGDISDRFHYLFSFYIFLLILVLTIIFSFPKFFVFGEYLIFLPFFILPSLVITWRQPWVLRQAFWPAIFFVVICFIVEFSLIGHGQWFWFSLHLLSVNIFGTVFPLMDIVSRFLLSFGIIIVYDFFMAYHENRSVVRKIRARFQ